jgi:hypothetical protein
MIFGVFVTISISAALILSRAPGAPSPSPSPSPAPRPLGAGRAAAALRSDELYALRARRRFTTYLRLRLLELREEGLDRAAAAIEHRIRIDELVPLPSPPPK